MKTRRHKNNGGYRQIRRGKTRSQVAAMARRMGVPFGKKNPLIVSNERAVLGAGRKVVPINTLGFS